MIPVANYNVLTLLIMPVYCELFDFKLMMNSNNSNLLYMSQLPAVPYFLISFFFGNYYKIFAVLKIIAEYQIELCEILWDFQGRFEIT